MISKAINCTKTKLTLALAIGNCNCDETDGAWMKHVYVMYNVFNGYMCMYVHHQGHIIGARERGKSE
jgi:hypothetical protein